MLFDHNEFNKHFKRHEKLVNFIFWFNLIITLAMLAGIVFVIYKILAFFGIL
jgi:hypothetical protein